MKVLSEAERSMCSLYETKGEGDATFYVRKYLAENQGEAVRFIACGGDGTLNEVAAGAAFKENASVTCYPCGSGNDFVKIFGGVSGFTDIRRLLSAKDRKIDLLYDGSRYADNVINFGFDTTVAMTVANARAKKGRAGIRYYTMGVIRALVHSMRNRFTITADGEVLNPGGEMLLCTIANGQYVGGSFRRAPRGARRRVNRCLRCASYIKTARGQCAESLSERWPFRPRGLEGCHHIPPREESRSDCRGGLCLFAGRRDYLQQSFYGDG